MTNTIRRTDPGALLRIALIALVAGCSRADSDVTETGEQSELLPPAAAFLGQGAVGLEARLDAIEADLATLLEQGLDDERQILVLRAEAMTDRLLEDEPSAAWLASGYLVEARLRQIQALADRVVSEMRRGVARELVLEDIAALRESVADLRTRLGQPGNSAPPPTLDSLLAMPTSVDRPLPAAPAADTASATAPEPAAPSAGPAGDPIGQPIQP